MLVWLRVIRIGFVYFHGETYQGVKFLVPPSLNTVDVFFPKHLNPARCRQPQQLAAASFARFITRFACALCSFVSLMLCVGTLAAVYFGTFPVW